MPARGKALGKVRGTQTLDGTDDADVIDGWKRKTSHQRHGRQ